VNITILIELKGIRMAAITGCNCPVTAKYNPTTLYIKESMKLSFIILMAFLEARIYWYSDLKFLASRMPSQAGEKTFTFSEMAIPTLL
jgi:hypothetical protein